MKVRYVNTTHRTMKLAEGINVPAKSFIDVEPVSNNTVQNLIRSGLLQVMNASASTASLPKDTGSASAAASKRAARMEAAAKKARADIESRVGTTSVPSNSKPMKATTNSKNLNAKGK